MLVYLYGTRKKTSYTKIWYKYMRWLQKTAWKKNNLTGVIQIAVITAPADDGPTTADETRPPIGADPGHLKAHADQQTDPASSSRPASRRREHGLRWRCVRTKQIQLLYYVVCTSQFLWRCFVNESRNYVMFVISYDLHLIYHLYFRWAHEGGGNGQIFLYLSSFYTGAVSVNFDGIHHGKKTFLRKW